MYLPAKRLAKAMKTAKGGTHLARMIMDCIWDKGTLAMSSVAEKSKHKYQQLDPHSVETIACKRKLRIQ